MSSKITFENNKVYLEATTGKYPSIEQPNPIILNPLLEMDRNEIYKGVPKLQLETWRNLFYWDGRLGNSSCVVSDNNDWAYNPQLLNLSYFESNFCLPFSDQYFWNDPSPTGDKQRKEVLYLLCQLDKMFDGDPSLPFRQALGVLMDALIDKIALSPNSSALSYFKDCSYFTPFNDPINDPIIATKQQLLCIKTTSGWRIGSFDTPSIGLLRSFRLNTTSGTHRLLINNQYHVIRHPCTLIEAFLLNNKTILVKLFVYDGTSEICDFEKKNAALFSFHLNMEKNDLSIKKFHQEMVQIEEIPCEADRVSQMTLDAVKNLAINIITAYACDLIEPIKNGHSEYIQLEIREPQSVSDKLLLLKLLIQELSKDPEMHADAIVYLAEEMDCAFTEKEIVESGLQKTGESLELGPKELAALMNKHIYNRYRQALLEEAPPLHTTNSLPTQTTTQPIILETTVPRIMKKERQSTVSSQMLPTPSNSSRATTCPELLAAKTLEKEKKREEYERRVEKQTREMANRSSSTQAQPQFNLSPKDEIIVESVYKGHPQKAKDFTRLAMHLLSQKTQAQGTSCSRNQRGSHPKVHLKRTDGASAGVTFRIHHGKKDQVGAIQHQKDTLNRILTL